MEEIDHETHQNEFEFQLPRYKRSLDLQHKYRTNSLKKLIELLKQTDIKHMKFVLKLKKVITI
jgi:hypothetical protein